MAVPVPVEAEAVPQPVQVPVVPDLEEDPAEQLLLEEQPEHREPLHPMAMGPRPLVTTRLLPTTAITTQVDRVPDPPVALSCEYLLDQRRSDAIGASAERSQMPAAMPAVTGMSMEIGSPTTMMMMTTRTTTTSMRETTTTSTTTTMPSRAPSSTTTTISSGSGTTSSGGRASGRPAAKFVPPPPPPRRLLLTQTDLSAAKVRTVRHRVVTIHEMYPSGHLSFAGATSKKIWRYC